MDTKSGKTDDVVLRTVRLDRLTRLGEPARGEILPASLPALVTYLASDRGVIQYDISGKVSADQSGSQKKRLRCIISGWFEVADPETLEPVRFDLDIDSRLIVVATEAELPPLENEPGDEDYVVCGTEFDIEAHLQEEVLLALPLDTPVSGSRGNTPSAQSAQDILAREMKKLGGAKSVRRQEVSPQAEGEPSAATVKPSPFAKLAVLKKSH